MYFEDTIKELTKKNHKKNPNFLGYCLTLFLLKNTQRVDVINYKSTYSYSFNQI